MLVLGDFFAVCLHQPIIECTLQTIIFATLKKVGISKEDFNYNFDPLDGSGVLTEDLPAHINLLLHFWCRKQFVEGTAGTWQSAPQSNLYCLCSPCRRRLASSSIKSDKDEVEVTKMSLEGFTSDDPEVLKKARVSAKTKVTCAYKLVK